MSKSKIVKIIISLVYVVFSAIFMFKLNSMNIIPNKYLLLVLGVVILLNVIASSCLLLKNNG